MGKISYLIVVICCLVKSKLYSQNYEVIYDVIFKPNLNDSSKIKDSYVLKFDTNKKESLFTSLKGANHLNTVVYKNFRKNEFVKYESIANGLYGLNYQFDSNNWKLFHNSRKVENYNCYKAEITFGNRIWEAWYTTEIPFQDGPYKFVGLPGLIVEIYSVDGDYAFILKGIEKKQSVEITKSTAIIFPNAEKEKDFKLGIINDPASQYRKQILQLKGNNMGVSVSYNGKEITQKETEKRIIDEFEQWRKEHDNPIEKGQLWIK